MKSWLTDSLKLRNGQIGRGREGEGSGGNSGLRRGNRKYGNEIFVFLGKLRKEV